MPHHVYTTRGVVLAVRPTREADAAAAILTRELGLVHASARGLRKRGSKLSGTLLDLSLVKVSLVRGKHAWRVTTVTLVENIATRLRSRRGARASLARVASLIRRLVRGEERHVELYDAFEDSVRKLLEEPYLDAESWEVDTVAHMLLHLGYLRESDMKLEKKELIKAINAGLRESGLV